MLPAAEEIVRSAVVVVVTALLALEARAEPITKVFLNGAVTPVYFNDGDSFRIQAGPFKGAQARLSGYNTLESFGPAHKWGSWTTKELYVIAKYATLEARRGVWHCEGDGKKDGYGRLLLFCKDLAASLIERGLAHTYSVDENPGDPDLLAVQREAIKNRRGMWAHGVPRNVVTSLHVKSEGGGKDGVTSNRLISTSDARTTKWIHNDEYEECQTVCQKVKVLGEKDVDSAYNAIKGDEKLAALNLDEATLKAALPAAYEAVARKVPSGTDDWAAFGIGVPGALTAEQRQVLHGAIERAVAAGKLNPSSETEDACMVHVDFRRRFGGERAACLR
jgi:endonuclease YncB( thermonuclease family)